MDKKRIYGEKVIIDTKSVKDFYEKRAKSSTSGNVGTVLLGNPDPQFLNERNAFDRDYVIPMLNIGSETRVLDIGCGIGRWAGFILPNCGFYCGVDFSPEMVRVTKQVCQNLGGHSALYCMPAAEAVNQTADFYGGSFETVIAAGVFTYINDSDAQHFFQQLPNLLAEHCIIYLEEPVGLQERLTLNDFPSEALQTSYSAIYRTPEEYMELYAPLFASGFSVMKQEYLPKMGDNYSDTGRYHFILSR